MNNIPKLNVLVIDDEANIRNTLRVCLESRGHTVTTVGNAQDALTEANRKVFDMAFMDIRLGTQNGMDLIPLLLKASSWIKIVVITAYATVDNAVEALRSGATDYIPKPFTPEQVELAAKRVSMVRSMEQRIDELKDDLERLHPKISFSSNCPSMLRALELARQVAGSEAVIMIRGESGTGKSVLAKAIHDWSPRSGKPFGVISCPTLSFELLESELFGHVKGAFSGAVRDNPGRVAFCEGGTIFLDEVADLAVTVQSKLLRFIQDREYERVGDHQTRKADVRIIAATNSDLKKAVDKGLFREDLYYRLNVIQIDLPPLSDRPDDVEKLANDMLGFFAAQNHKVITGFDKESITAMRSYSWPGNIRELRNVVERAAILCETDKVLISHLPSSISRFPDPLNRDSATLNIGDPVKLSEIEENHIRSVIADTKTLQDAAEILGIDQATLWRKRKQYGI